MSVPVPLEKLRAALAERGDGAYLLTVSDDAAPHAVHVRVAWDGEALAVDVGRRSAANAAARPRVSLLYAVRTEGDYSVIVDGTATAVPGAAEPRLRITPSRAVMHRAAAAPDPSASCGADCVPLLDPSPAPARGR
jgi:hypothetical protein